MKNNEEKTMGAINMIKEIVALEEQLESKNAELRFLLANIDKEEEE